VAVAVLSVAGCGVTKSGTPGEPGGPEIQFEELAMETGPYPEPTAAISDHPVDLDAFAGWRAAGAPDPSGDPLPADPDKAYVVFTESTGCRMPETVDLTRDGDELTVHWIGGEEREECAAPFNPLAHLAVDKAAVDGVRSVSGAKMVDPDGPAKLTDFVDLGPLDPVGIQPITLADKETLVQQLTGAGAEDVTEARAALDRPVPAGSTGYAFVLPGCGASHAVMVVTVETLTARLSGASDVVCDAQFGYLAVFHLPDRYRPESAQLGG
jgi:hypothetical protein